MPHPMPQNNNSKLIHNTSAVKNLRSAVEFCNIDGVPQAVREVLRTGAWAKRYDMMRIFEFERFSDFIIKPVREGGCGWNPPSNIEALLAKSGDIEAQAMFRQAMVGKPGAHHDIVMRKAEQG